MEDLGKDLAVCCTFSFFLYTVVFLGWAGVFYIFCIIVTDIYLNHVDNSNVFSVVLTD